jgi:hypothetical protein
MPVIANSVILRCPPEVVFDYLSDHRAELEWNPKCERIEKLTEGPVGVGTTARRLRADTTRLVPADLPAVPGHHASRGEGQHGPRA